MATAAGFKDVQVVYGYLREPKDNTHRVKKQLNNHAWCSVKVEGEYRFFDCWLASPYHPQNNNKMELHWFMTSPLDMVMTHLPEKEEDQHLQPSLSPSSFFQLPYFRHSFHWYQIDLLQHHLGEDVENNKAFFVSLKIQSDIGCYAETESDDGTCHRALAQSLVDEHENRTYNIKAVLPPNKKKGWLKIYAGPRASPSNLHQLPINKSCYPLVICYPLTSTKYYMPLEFVQLYVGSHEFYIQEPQCYQLYKSQSCEFRIKGMPTHNQIHHKLAVKSPSGRLFKLLYYPQDLTYTSAITITELGKWSLVYLLHHTGGWCTIASWDCST
ncbi:hypothetical protein BDB01DRAFT_842321 [Pilobolus umbonatus]|nr:hypothetical protein BDB01DRAFT_842321 [Pilobolus umbonatus]